MVLSFACVQPWVVIALLGIVCSGNTNVLATVAFTFLTSRAQVEKIRCLHLSFSGCQTSCRGVVKAWSRALCAALGLSKLSKVASLEELHHRNIGTTHIRCWRRMRAQCMHRATAGLE